MSECAREVWQSLEASAIIHVEIFEVKGQRRQLLEARAARQGERQEAGELRYFTRQAVKGGAVIEADRLQVTELSYLSWQILEVSALSQNEVSGFSQSQEGQLEDLTWHALKLLAQEAHFCRSARDVTNALSTTLFGTLATSTCARLSLQPSTLPTATISRTHGLQPLQRLLSGQRIDTYAQTSAVIDPSILKTQTHRHRIVTKHHIPQIIGVITLQNPQNGLWITK